ncbi:hypothetical protein F4803DRAFT_274782 [Xylaria telfairii]|nr:hypothetical protein F4803DRAFT_274782 [Xylaria telfairii]
MTRTTSKPFLKPCSFCLWQSFEHEISCLGHESAQKLLRHSQNTLQMAITDSECCSDGLIDVSHGADWITISNTYFHDHWKASLVGHSDSNSAEDKGHLTVTYANNCEWSLLIQFPFVAKCKGKDARPRA